MQSSRKSSPPIESMKSRSAVVMTAVFNYVASGWAQLPTHVTLTDTLERARELAEELLRNTVGR